MFILNKSNAPINDFILGANVSIAENETVKVIDVIGEELLKKYGFLVKIEKAEIKSVEPIKKEKPVVKKGGRKNEKNK